MQKDEIKEKQLSEVLYGLDYIGNKIKNDDGKLELGVNNCKILLNYITNLQEEKERLKELCDKYEEEHNTAFKLWIQQMKEIPTYEEKKDLKYRINKAIEYIEKYSSISGYYFNSKYNRENDCLDVKERLLNILQNGEENE